MKPSLRPQILIIGNDPTLPYLISRHAQHGGGCDLADVRVAPPLADIRPMGPAAMLFSSAESLEASQPLVADPADRDVPVLTCSSMTDEARACALGADHCQLQPLTCDGFVAALVATRAEPGTNSGEPSGFFPRAEIAGRDQETT